MTTPVNTIPLIDMTAVVGAGIDAADWQDFVQAVGEGFRKDGFIALRGHGLWPSNPKARSDTEMLGALYNDAQQVFALSDEQKEMYSHPAFKHQRGWKNYPRYHWQIWNVGASHNMFPTQVPRFEQSSMTYFGEMERIAVILIQALDDYFDAKGALESTVLGASGRVPIGTHQMTVNHHKAVTETDALEARKEEDDPNLYRRQKQHTDWEFITLLPKQSFTGDKTGLQIHKGDQWQDVSVEDGAIIVNAGDMLALMSQNTDKAIPSTVHRVVGDKTQMASDRYSAPLFVSPNYDKPLIDLATGEPVVFKDTVLDKAAQYFFYKMNNDADIPHLAEQYREWYASMAPLIQRG